VLLSCSCVGACLDVTVRGCRTEKGLSVATSPSAVERLLTLRQAKVDADAAKATDAKPSASIETVRGACATCIASD
jgi:hypothetical protein